MGFLSKLFGGSGSSDPYVEIPDDLSSNGVIRMAVGSVVQELGGNCATLEPDSDQEGWVQVMDGQLNCAYPHAGDPQALFAELLSNPLVDEFEDFEPEVYMMFSLKSMNEDQLSVLIERYFKEVLSIDTGSCRLLLRMEKV